MAENSLTPVIIERAMERLRQEKETFEQRKRHDNLWFYLRLAMGFSSIVLLAAIMVVSSIVIFNNKDYPLTIVKSSGIALFTDVLGLLIAVWKIVLNPKSETKLSPVSDANFDDPPTEETSDEQAIVRPKKVKTSPNKKNTPASKDCG